uniref:Uncharacterized protein n=1 Tax=Euplotes crassus TaxID=5936 RepID=A0A7S3K8J2_EUPCR
MKPPMKSIFLLSVVRLKNVKVPKRDPVYTRALVTIIGSTSAARSTNGLRPIPLMNEIAKNHADLTNWSLFPPFFSITNANAKINPTQRQENKISSTMSLVT